MTDAIREAAEQAFRIYHTAAPHVKERQSMQLLGTLAKAWLAEHADNWPNPKNDSHQERDRLYALCKGVGVSMDQWLSSAACEAIEKLQADIKDERDHVFELTTGCTVASVAEGLAQIERGEFKTLDELTTPATAEGSE